MIDSDEYIVKRAQECRAIETTFRPVGWPLQPADKWRNGAHRVIATGAHVKGKGRVTANRDTVVARATCHRVAPAAPKIPSAAALQSVKKEKQIPTNGTRLVAKRRRRRVGARSAATTAHHLLSGGDDSTATVEKNGSVGRRQLRRRPLERSRRRRRNGSGRPPRRPPVVAERTQQDGQLRVIGGGGIRWQIYRVPSVVLVCFLRRCRRRRRRRRRRG